MKRKLIIIYSSIFLVFLLLPLFFQNKVEFNYGIFFTQYYIFIFNLFLVIILGYYINNRFDTIKESLKTSIQRKELLSNIKELNKNLNDGDDLDIIKIYWSKIFPTITDGNFVNYQISTILNKNNNFVKSLNENNFHQKIKTPDYTTFKKNIDNLVILISNEIY